MHRSCGLKVDFVLECTDAARASTRSIECSNLSTTKHGPFLKHRLLLTDRTALLIFLFFLRCIMWDVLASKVRVLFLIPILSRLSLSYKCWSRVCSGSITTP